MPVGRAPAARRQRAPAGLGGPAQRALRRAPPGRGDGHGHRRDARHDPERRPPAPHRRWPTPGCCRPARRRGHPASRVARSGRTASRRAAEPLFPRAYGELTNQLLGYVPAGAVAAAFQHRRDDRIAGARARLAGKRSFAAKVTELAKILDEDGYLASVEPIAGGGFRIAERNCAIFAVAREHPQACSTELEFLRAALPEAEIERVTHMMAGAHACSYEVRRR